MLQVNGGPALEAVALPELCESIVNDVLQLVYDPYFYTDEEVGSEASAAPAEPAFVLVYKSTASEPCAAHGPSAVCPSCLDMFEPGFLDAHSSLTKKC